MFRGFSSLLGLFFVTAGVFAVASLTKNPTVAPASLPYRPNSPGGARYLAMEAAVFHARFSLN
jgi:hypothetical protein